MDFMDKITCNIECKICCEKFIKLKSTQYYIFLEENEHLLPNNFEDNTCCRLYEDRFECLTCKNIACRNCYWCFKGHYFKPDDDWIEHYKFHDVLDKDGFVEGIPGESCPIICPFCRTKDYKIFYGNQVPYELLHDIKNRHLKSKK